MSKRCGRRAVLASRTVLQTAARRRSALCRAETNALAADVALSRKNLHSHPFDQRPFQRLERLLAEAVRAGGGRRPSAPRRRAEETG